MWHALFFASIVRELGFPVREANVPLSGKWKGANKYIYQEAAVEIWFDGAWHYYDAYLTNNEGNEKIKSQTSPNGLLGGDFTDRKVHITKQGATNYNKNIAQVQNGGYEFDNGDPVANTGWIKADGDDKNTEYEYEKALAAISIEETDGGRRIYVTHAGQTTGVTQALAAPTIPDSLKILYTAPETSGALVEIPVSGYVPAGVPLPDGQESALTTVDFAVEKVVLGCLPSQGSYCVSVWDHTGTGGSFRLVITTEGGALTDLPAVTVGSLPPSGSQTICGSACTDIDGNSVCDSMDLGDCNANSVADGCDLMLDPYGDCNQNSALDVCEISGGPSLDSNQNGLLDSCEIGACCMANTTCSALSEDACALNGGSYFGAGTSCGATDADFDGRALPCDCNDGDSAVWDIPGQVSNLMFVSKTTLTWSPPANPGGSVLYDVLVGQRPPGGQPVFTCFASNVPGTSAVDNSPVPPGPPLLYLVRAQTSCAEGTVAPDGHGSPRVVPSCP